MRAEAGVLLAAMLAAGCSLMTEPPNERLYAFVQVWGKDYGGSAGPGFGDGTAGSSPGAFDMPVRLAAKVGRVWVLEAGNKRVQMFSSEGVPVMFEDQGQAWANTLGREGVGSNEFLGPADLAVGDDGRIVVADAENASVKVFGAAGSFQARLAFLKNGAPWPTNAPGGYLRPSAVAIDASGRIYVADTMRRSIDRYMSDLVLDGSWGSGGSLVRPEFGAVVAMACEADRLYLLERSGVRVLAQAGGQEISRWDRFGYGVDRLAFARGMAVREGEVFVADGPYVKIFGPGGDFRGYVGGGLGSRRGELRSPRGVAVVGDRIYVCDTDNHRVQVFERRR